MDNKIDNPDNYLLLDSNGMAIGFKIDDGEWGPDMDHKETFRRVIWEDTDVECEMMRFIAYVDNIYTTTVDIIDRETDVSEGAIGFADRVPVTSSFSYNDVFSKVNIASKTPFKYYCSRRHKIFNYHFTDLCPYYNPEQNSMRIKSLHDTTFKYFRNVVNLDSIINIAYSDVKFSPVMLKYLNKLKYIGCRVDYDKEKDEFTFTGMDASTSLIRNKVFTKNPENSEVITNQDVVNRCLEFVFSEYMPKSVIHIGSIINGYDKKYNTYLDIKYTGDKSLMPLTSVKRINVICQTLNSFDSNLFKLFPNLENYGKIGYYFPDSYKLLDNDAFSNFPNLKIVDDFRSNLLLSDDTFKNNKNLETIIGRVVGRSDVFTIDVFKNNPKIKNLNSLFTNSMPDTYIDNINLVLKSFAKYCNITNIDELFRSNSYISVPEAFYELDKTKITSCNKTFYNAINLTHLPELWDKSQYPNIVEHDQCFYNCTAADNYDQVPSDWK